MKKAVILDKSFDLECLSAIDKSGVRVVEVIPTLSVSEWLALQSYARKIKEQQEKNSQDG